MTQPHHRHVPRAALGCPRSGWTQPHARAPGSSSGQRAGFQPQVGRAHPPRYRVPCVYQAPGLRPGSVSPSSPFAITVGERPPWGPLGQVPASQSLGPRWALPPHTSETIFTSCFSVSDLSPAPPHPQLPTDPQTFHLPAVSSRPPGRFFLLLDDWSASPSPCPSTASRPRPSTTLCASRPSPSHERRRADWPPAETDRPSWGAPQSHLREDIYTPVPCFWRSRGF